MNKKIKFFSSNSHYYIETSVNEFINLPNIKVLDIQFQTARKEEFEYLSVMVHYEMEENN